MLGAVVLIAAGDAEICLRLRISSHRHHRLATTHTHTHTHTVAPLLSSARRSFSACSEATQQEQPDRETRW